MPERSKPFSNTTSHKHPPSLNEYHVALSCVRTTFFEISYRKKKKGGNWTRKEYPPVAAPTNSPFMYPGH